MFTSHKTLSLSLISSTTIMMAATIVFAILPTRGSGQHAKKRSIEIKTYKNQPMEILSVRLKGTELTPGKKFEGDTDWYDGLTITIKNTSDKPVVWATVVVLAYQEKDGRRRKTSDGRDI